jgi:flagellar secretion chaperone FliS
MNPYAAYQNNQNPAWTRIDMLLALYDGAIGRLESAAMALRLNDVAKAAPLLERSLAIVAELAAGLDFRHGELPVNLLRLYEFAVHCIATRTVGKVEDALGVLRELREGMLGIRDEAVRLEREGVIPPANTVGRMEMIA